MCLVHSDNERDACLSIVAAVESVGRTGQGAVIPGLLGLAHGDQPIVPRRRAASPRDPLGISNPHEDSVQQQVCDAPRCPGLHAQDNGAESKQNLSAWAAVRLKGPASTGVGNLRACDYRPCWGSRIATVCRERGMPSRRRSSACSDCVPATCTHRPSLLPMMR